mgnify:CR=1 FL=1
MARAQQHQRRDGVRRRGRAARIGRHAQRPSRLLGDRRSGGGVPIERGPDGEWRVAYDPRGSPLGPPREPPAVPGHLVLAVSRVTAGTPMLRWRGRCRGRAPAWRSRSTTCPDGGSSGGRAILTSRRGASATVRSHRCRPASTSSRLHARGAARRRPGRDAAAAHRRSGRDEGRASHRVRRRLRARDAGARRAAPGAGVRGRRPVRSRDRGNGECGDRDRSRAPGTGRVELAASIVSRYAVPELTSQALRPGRRLGSVRGAIGVAEFGPARPRMGRARRRGRRVHAVRRRRGARRVARRGSARPGAPSDSSPAAAAGASDPVTAVGQRAAELDRWTGAAARTSALRSARGRRRGRCSRMARTAAPPPPPTATRLAAGIAFVTPSARAWVGARDRPVRGSVGARFVDPAQDRVERSSHPSSPRRCASRSASSAGAAAVISLVPIVAVTMVARSRRGPRPSAAVEPPPEERAIGADHARRARGPAPPH